MKLIVALASNSTTSPAGVKAKSIPKKSSGMRARTASQNGANCRWEGAALEQCAFLGDQFRPRGHELHAGIAVYVPLVGNQQVPCDAVTPEEEDAELAVQRVLAAEVDEFGRNIIAVRFDRGGGTVDRSEQADDLATVRTGSPKDERRLDRRRRRALAAASPLPDWRNRTVLGTTSPSTPVSNPATWSRVERNTASGGLTTRAGNARGAPLSGCRKSRRCSPAP